MIEQRKLGRTGLSVSCLGFGAAPAGLLETDRQRFGAILNELFDKGVNLIDTAAAYGIAEEAIGDLVSHRRSEYVLVSKCGQSFPDLPGEEWSPEVISATVDRSLQRLNTDHLDVMLLHSCSQEVLEKGEAFGALLRAREAGKIRFAGYSGDNEAVAYAASVPELAVVEASFNIADQANVGGLLKLADGNGLGVIAKRPVANAAWKPLNEQPGFYADYARDYHERLKAMHLSLQDFDVEDWGELALRFTLALPAVHTAIIGTTNPDNARKNIAAAAKGPLSIPEVDKIFIAFSRAQRESGTHWPSLQ